MSDPESSTPEGVKLKSESGGVEESDKPNDTADYISVISDAQLSVSEPSCISNGTPPESNDIRADDIRVLKQELETFRKRADQTPPGGDVLKKQYEAKLKDVMEKAREHARKIASERDELKKQVEEKDLKITNFKQVMTSATAEIGSKDIRIAELEDQSRSSSSRAAKLEEQMAAMEAHYTKAPSGKQTATLSVRDSLTDGGSECLLGTICQSRRGLTLISFERMSERLRVCKNSLKRPTVNFKNTNGKWTLFFKEDLSHPLPLSLTTAFGRPRK